MKKKWQQFKLWLQCRLGRHHLRIRHSLDADDGTVYCTRCPYQAKVQADKVTHEFQVDVDFRDGFICEDIYEAGRKVLVIQFERHRAAKHMQRLGQQLNKTVRIKHKAEKGDAPFQTKKAG